MHVLHRSSLIYLWWNNYVIIRPFCHIIVVCLLWTWHIGSKLGWYRPDAGSHRADASVFLTHNAIHIQSGEGAYRRGNSLDDSRLWSAAVEPDGRACAEWTINPTVPVCIVDQTGVQPIRCNISYSSCSPATTWGLSSYEDHLSRYGDFHYKNKTVMRLCYLYNGNSFTGKTTSFYWDGPRLGLWSSHHWIQTIYLCVGQTYMTCFLSYDLA